jgi:hypothetical protein
MLHNCANYALFIIRERSYGLEEFIWKFEDFSSLVCDIIDCGFDSKSPPKFAKIRTQSFAHQ